MINVLHHGSLERFAILLLAACGLAWLGTAGAQDGTAAKLLPVTVELGDVSLTKLPFIMAADNGIYERAGLKVDQFITPSAATCRPLRC